METGTNHSHFPPQLTAFLAVPKKHSWEKVFPLLPQNRYAHTSTLYRHYVIIYGGSRGDEWGGCGDILVYNLKKKRWERIRLEGDKPAPRRRHSAFLFDSNKIIVFGGEGSLGTFNEVAIITIKEKTRKNSLSLYWLQPALTIEYKVIETFGGKNVPHYNFSASVNQNKLYFVFGGSPFSNIDRVWTLNLSKIPFNESASHFLLGTFKWARRLTTGDTPSKFLLKLIIMKLQETESAISM